MKVPYFYSTNPRDPDVYHWRDDCPAGKQIPLANKEYGKPAGHRECKDCVRIGY